MARRRRARRNPVTESRILDLITEAVHRYKREGNRGIDWTFDHMTNEERLAFDLFLVRTKDPLAWEAGTVEHRFRTRVRRMAGEENPKRKRTARRGTRRNPLQYRTVDTRTVKGIEEAERLQAAGWKIVRSGMFSTGRVVYRAGRANPGGRTRRNPLYFEVGRGGKQGQQGFGVGFGYRRRGKENPTLAIFGNPPRGTVKKQLGRVVEVRYKRDDDGKLYFHKYTSRPRLCALSDGSIWITP